MNDINTKCLEVFPGWLDSLGENVQVILDVLEKKEMSEDIRRNLAGGINYLFKSLDLIPDGIDDIGYLDDAFILRLAARSACDCGLEGLDDQLRVDLGKLAEDTVLIKDLLGDDLFARLQKYTGALSNGAARGRTVDELISSDGVFNEFSSEVAVFIKDYSSPGFSNDEKNIIKMKAFLDAKLPK